MKFFRRWVVIFGWSTFLIWIVVMWTMPEASHNPPVGLFTAAALSTLWLFPACILTGAYELIVRPK